MFQIYDTNLSWRLQIGFWRVCVVVDYWYDRASRVNLNWPLEFRFYFQETWTRADDERLTHLMSDHSWGPVK